MIGQPRFPNLKAMPTCAILAIDNSVSGVGEAGMDVVGGQSFEQLRRVSGRALLPLAVVY
jgi:hypothetical protein